MTDLTDSIGGTFDAKMTGKIINIISTVLDVRGATPPDAAIDKIDQIIRTVAANNPAEVIAVKSDRVALISTSSSPSLPLSQFGGGWLSVFGGGKSAEAVQWQDEVDQMTEKAALVALDQPVQVQFHLTASSATAAPAATATTTTLAQFSGGRNPYWPSPYSSSDIISLTVSSSSSWKQRQLITTSPSEEGGGRHRLGHRRLDNNVGGGGGGGDGNGVEGSGKINITFETSTPLWYVQHCVASVCLLVVCFAV